MLEALECSHFIGFCLKRLHWQNKYDSCSSPNSPEDPKLNLRSFQEGWVSTPEVLCFSQCEWWSPQSRQVFTAVPQNCHAMRISSPGIFHNNESQQVYDYIPLHHLFPSLRFFSPLLAWCEEQQCLGEKPVGNGKGAHCQGRWLICVYSTEEGGGALKMMGGLELKTQSLHNSVDSQSWWNCILTFVVVELLAICEISVFLS